MSRIGSKPINVESGVTILIEDGGRFGYKKVSAKGPKGELSIDIQRGIALEKMDNQIVITRKNDSKQNKSYHGLYRTLIANMIEGVTSGFEKHLEIVGVGFRAKLVGNDLELYLGYTHPILVVVPDGIKFTLDDEVNIKIIGINKELVGNVAAKIRELKKPEPYKGKGIRYKGEHVIRKAGKTGA